MYGKRVEKIKTDIGQNTEKGTVDFDIIKENPGIEHYSNNRRQRLKDVWHCCGKLVRKKPGLDYLTMEKLTDTLNNVNNLKSTGFLGINTELLKNCGT